MKIKDYMKNLKKGEYKTKVMNKEGYVREMHIEKNGELEQYTLGLKDFSYGMFYPYLFHYAYVAYYEWSYLKKKIIKDYGEWELKQDD